MKNYLLPYLLLSILITSSCKKEEIISDDGLPQQPTTVDTASIPTADTTNVTDTDTVTVYRETVDTVIISRYAGLWYEIATIPQIFQTGCNCTTAEYGPTSDPDKISVTNSCNLFSSNGLLNRLEGSATIVPGSGNAKLLVSFFGFGGADYWIIDLDRNYLWAVVGSPTKEFFWILSRTRELDENLYQSLLHKWEARGYDVSKVKLTNQIDC